MENPPVMNNLMLTWHVTWSMFGPVILCTSTQWIIVLNSWKRANRWCRTWPCV